MLKNKDQHKILHVGVSVLYYNWPDKGMEVFLQPNSLHRTNSIAKLRLYSHATAIYRRHNALKHTDMITASESCHSVCEAVTW